MSRLTFTPLTLPAADLGGENPLAPLAADAEVHAGIQFGDGVPDEIRRQAVYGRHNGCLPYRIQDGYNRARRPRSMQAAVLENDMLRATFLPELGGRLASLVYLPEGRELLAANPVFQPANLAIRNAWFSGGVEWNIGLIGHSPFTCSPLFAEELATPDGTPVLRLREWERIRRTPFQIDVWLPDGSPFLFVHVAILNPNAEEVPMYWWSNIAVPEAPGHRVLAPASHAFRFGYGRKMDRIPMPLWEGMEVSYPVNIDRAADFFFDLPPGRRPWIASLDPSGNGLVQTSTARLRGRKLFVWGMAPGGRRWQEFLSVPGLAYVEIQAGLARTQSEHIPMPPGALWSWTEAYGPFSAPPEAVHSRDWEAAWQCVGRELDARLPSNVLDDAAALGDHLARQPALGQRQAGTGWGALEARRLAARGVRADWLGGGFAADMTGPEQESWLRLIEDGVMPASDPAAEPGAWMIQPEWHRILEDAIRTGGADHWLGWLHLGVMRFADGDRDGAAAAWRTSLERNRSAWALRNLAVLARQAGRSCEAAGLLEEACGLLPDLLPLAVELGTALLEAGRPADWLGRLDGVSGKIKTHGRIRLLAARGHIDLGQFSEAEAILRSGLEVSDVREGETSLSDTWFDLATRRLAAETNRQLDDGLRADARRVYPLPPYLDFRGQAAQPAVPE